MLTRLLPRLQHFKPWQLTSLVVIVSLFLTEISVAFFSIIVRGHVPYSALVVGLLAGLLVSVVVASVFVFLLNEIAKQKVQLLEVGEQKAKLDLEMAIEAAQIELWELDLTDYSLKFNTARINIPCFTANDPPRTLQDWLSSIHPDDAGPFQQRMQQAMLPDAANFDFEYRVALDAGQWAWVHTRGGIIQRDAAGKPLLAAGSTINITERKQAEYLLSQAVEAAQLVLWELELSTGVLRFDDSRLRWLGAEFKSDVHTISAWLAHVHPDDQLVFMEKFQQAVSASGVKFDCEYRLKARNDSWIWVQTKGQISQRHASGEPILGAGSTFNIQSRKLAEEQLVRNESLLHATLESTDEGILMIGHDGRVLSANKRFHELWRIPKEVADTGRDDLLLGHVLEQLTDPAVFLDQVKRLYDSDEEARDILHFKDGRVFARFTQALRINRERGRIWCFKDISEQSHAEYELRQSDQRFRTLFDSSPDPIWIVDGHRFVECNQAAVDMLGYPNKGALRNIHPSELSPEFQPDGEPSFNKAEQMMNIAQEKGINRFEWVHKRKDGSEFYAEVTLSPITLQNRQAIYCVWRNITERKRIERALLAESEKSSALLRNASDGIHILDSGGNVVEASDSFCAMLGYTRDEVIGMNVSRWDANFNAGDLKEALLKQFNTPVRSEFESVHRRKDGSLFDVEISGFPLELSGKQLLFNSSRDITARKNIETELRTTKERYDFATMIGKVGIWDWNPLTGVLAWSDETFRLMGYAPGSVIPTYELYLGLVHPDDRAQLNSDVRAALRKKKQYALDCRIILGNGNEIVCHVTGKVEFDAGDQPVRMLGTIQDITERKRIELALADSRNLLKTVIDTSPMRVFWKDRDLRYLGCNPAFAKDAGRASPEEMLGKDDYEMAWRAQAERYRADDRQIMDSGIGKLSYDEPQTTPDGDTIWLRTSKVPLRNEGGETIGLLGIYEDITDHKKAELALKTSEQKLLTILDNVDAFIYLKDTEGKYLFANRNVRELWEAEMEDIVGFGDGKFFDEATAANIRINDRGVLDRGETLTTEETNTVIATGKTFTYLSTKLPLRRDNGSIYALCGVSTDITSRKQSEEILRASEERAKALANLLRLIADNVTDMIWAKDLNKRYLFANKAICDRLLNARDTDEPIGKDDMFFAARERDSRPDDPGWHTFGELCQDSDAITLQNGRPSQFDEYGNAQGKFLFLDVHKAPFVNDKGEVIGVVGSGRDVTQQKAIEEKLKLASLVLENSSEAMFITDEKNAIIEVNPAFTLLTGYGAEDAIGKNPKFLRSGKHDEAFYRTMKNELAKTGHWQGEIWNRRKNGEIFAEWLTINTIYNEDGSVHRHVALFSDITEKKRSEEIIWSQANFDQLTNLPNRRMFRDRLAQDIKKAHRVGLGLALMLLDLDRFKEVNDSLGHDSGDALLQEAAQRITACVRESDTVARLGGDEFTIILAELDDLASVERIAVDILRSLSQPFGLGNDIAYVSASIGITLYPDDATSLEDMLKNADQAMYVAKNAGRNRFSYFTSAMQERALYRLHMINDLRGALAEQQFQLHYQPIVDIRTGQIHKAEALLCWFHPKRGLISPVEFIPLAEESGLIHEIGDWVFEQVAVQALKWTARYGSDFQISLNKSPIQLLTKSDRCRWKEHLARTGLSGKNVVIEITEGVLLDHTPAVISELLAFRDAGIQVAIDDFGTGYSALSYLKKLDIDYVKIDQSFILHLETDDNDKALAEAIVVMAHKLGLKVIAEGVESHQQLDLLAKMGCDYAQGFLFSRALAPEDFDLLMKSGER